MCNATIMAENKFHFGKKPSGLLATKTAFGKVMACEEAMTVLIEVALYLPQLTSHKREILLCFFRYGLQLGIKAIFLYISKKNLLCI